MKSKLLILIIWFYGVIGFIVLDNIAGIGDWQMVALVLAWSIFWVAVFKKLI